MVVQQKQDLQQRAGSRYAYLIFTKLLSQGKFNHFYVRAVCLEALAQGMPQLTIYRVRASSQLRTESEARINTEIETQELLKQLQKDFSFMESYFSVGPDSGLSAYFKKL